MTRILALADTQIGVATVDLQDQREVLDRIVQVALDREVDLVIHAGDVFEGPTVLPEHLRLFIDATKPLRHNCVPLIVIRGNGRHDMATRPTHALDVLREIEGIIVSDRPELLSSVQIWPAAWINTEPVSVATLPWVHPGNLIAKTEGAIDHDDVNGVATRLLVRIAGDLIGKGQTPWPRILVAHWAISGSKLPTGLGVEEMREPVLPFAELDALGYDAIIAGHIHEPQRIDHPPVDKTLCVVPGSPQQLNHGEKGDHGCWIIEVGGDLNERVPEFVPIPSKRFVTLDLTDELVKREPTADTKLARISDGDIVRVRYTATEEEARQFEHSKVRAILEHAGASRVQIEPQILKAARARVESINEQLTQVEALREWCRANNIEEALRDRMLDTLRDWSAT